MKVRFYKLPFQIKLNPKRLKQNFAEYCIIEDFKTILSKFKT
jgi:hypothetical protein